MDPLFQHSRLLWKPVNPSRSRLDAFRRFVNHRHNINLKDYYDLHDYSVSDYSFWTDLWAFLGIIYSVPPKAVIEPGPIPESPIWYPGARLNFAENILVRNDDSIAITAMTDSGVVEHCTWKELRALVRQMTAALRIVGLKTGDRVAAVIRNSVTSIVLALAVTSIGGIFSSTAPDMGTHGILDRYRQITPKFIFAETEVCYAGKVINLVSKITEVAKDLSNKGLHKVILLPSAATGKESTYGVARGITLSDFLSTDDGRELLFEQLPFSHPAFILYSSGTSGPPKCIVHSGGGVLLTCKKDGTMSFDFQPDDTYLHFTTTGWMMWTFMLIILSCGIRVVAYDGSPFHPSLEHVLKLVSDQRVTVFGVSPRFLTEIQSRDINPRSLASFDSLRLIFSTGAVLTPPVFEWTQKAFGEHIHLASSSGGTDICGAFVTSNPTLPVYTGEIQCKVLGMKVEVFDPQGNNIEHTGQPGELVCTRPHPSIPVGFWGDEDGNKFRSAYFDMYPGVWRQGDFIVVNPKTKGLIILGRSDGVLNPSGVRFGSAEIYTVMEQFSSEIDDTLCVGQRRPQDLDERVLLFVKMRQGHRLTKDLEKRIKEKIRKELSPRHVPRGIFEVADIPYTVNNKKIEIAVKQIVSGSTIKPSGTVANPKSLELYYKYRELPVEDGNADIRKKEKTRAKL